MASLLSSRNLIAVLVVSLISGVYSLPWRARKTPKNPFDDLNERRETMFPKWINNNGLVKDDSAVSIGELGDLDPIICRFAIDEALIPGTLDAKTGICSSTWKGKIVSSEKSEYLQGSLMKLEWAESNQGNVPTGALIGGVTETGDKIYIIRQDIDKWKVDFVGGKLIKGENHGTTIKEGKESLAPIYEVLCLQTVIV